MLTWDQQHARTTLFTGSGQECGGGKSGDGWRYDFCKQSHNIMEPFTGGHWAVSRQCGAERPGGGGVTSRDRVLHLSIELEAKVHLKVCNHGEGPYLLGPSPG